MTQMNKKIPLCAMLTLLTAASHAGRGAFLVIDNGMGHAISSTRLSDSCLKASNDLDKSVTFISISYFEADNKLKNGCLFKASTAAFGLDLPFESLAANFWIADSASGWSSIAQSSQVSLLGKVHNSANRLFSQDLLTLAVWPKMAIYADWMRDNAKGLMAKELKHIALPGSHDSLSYDLIPVAGNDPKYEWFFNLPIAKTIAMNYAKTQYSEFDLSAQLNNGIRYFDLRTCTKKVEAKDNTDQKPAEIYGCHAFITRQPIEYYLKQVNDFLNEHRSEIVILDFNHLGSNLQLKDILGLEKTLQSIFGSKIAYYASFGPASTINQFWQQHKQLVITSDLSEALIKQQQLTSFWPQSTLTSPWPNSVDRDQVFSKMHDNLNERDPNKLFVLQMQQTPGANYILEHLDNSVYGITYRNKADIYDWLNNNQQLLRNNGNILLEDFTIGNNLTAVAIGLNNQP